MELGEIKKVNLPAFTVIGKEGSGLAAEGSSWVPLLWDNVNEHFEEIAANVTLHPSEIHLWGLMSDESAWLEPWQEIGRYLAGIAVPTHTEVPAGWQKWQMPPSNYFVIKTNVDNLAAMTEKMLMEILPQNNMTLSAAIQEHYLPEFAPGEVELYFPVTGV
ncbi:GyrI-like domain-containing protein [Enterococcus dispar]|uniref:AraC effector-binding domain-containing protein n=2 Tax=Enterococcus dispar TaxID=44009 RepID=S0KJC5_9ENTE|nr:GyrI-like domain-containing protein [Enterococcus dispar]EOT41075.1 hypothetical protein OMK_01244 [Enterococcus dispar ATCC 51266]EOW87291.1 hypothetical protein I569_02662 [Enterococcus dispar ATCC 51266]MCU7356381.1 GyrI-like domain-containing protein [Enterococcus dispar]MDT2704578.1 GyrI-like domain-containing protein [Enterococcus dispar]OJG38774.1 hypothetical protein RV01_GL002220 [Enterococcus dispar]